jgi:hypothetical protein
MNGRLRHFFSRLHRDRLLGGVLDVDLEVVLQVLADAGQVVHDVDAERLEVVRVADAGELQQLRRVDRAAAQDHLAGGDGVPPRRRCAVVDADARVPSKRTR